MIDEVEPIEITIRNYRCFGDDPPAKFVLKPGFTALPTGPSEHATLADEEQAAMTIEIKDHALSARIQKQMAASGSASVDDLLERLLETQEEQDRWLLENREALNSRIQLGLDQLDRGEGIPEDQLDAYLAELKSRPERGGATTLRRRQRQASKVSVRVFLPDRVPAGVQAIACGWNRARQSESNERS